MYTQIACLRRSWGAEERQRCQKRCCELRECLMGCHYEVEYRSLYRRLDVRTGAAATKATKEMRDASASVDFMIAERNGQC